MASVVAEVKHWAKQLPYWERVALDKALAGHQFTDADYNELLQYLLEDAGLVGFKKDGLWVNYHLSNGSGSPYASSALGNLRHWLEDDTEVTDLIKKLPEIRREDICRK